MNKIFCIVGKSCSGKDTFYSRILALKQPGLRPVTPYTTRPIRKGETDGQNYHFVTEDQLRQYEAENRVIEKREYHTTQGLWTYFTLRFELDTDRLLITTLEGAESLMGYYGQPAVCVVYLHVDDRTRLVRCIDREDCQENPDYTEVCRRFLADQEDFSAERLARFPRLYTIDTGGGIEECLEQWDALYRAEK